MESIFIDKNKMPDDNAMLLALGDSYQLWQMIKDYVFTKYPQAKELWSCSKYGWSFRINDKKRAILYLLPRDSFFKVAFVFGQKATDIILKSSVSKEIKEELKSARVYAEGRGIRINIKSDSQINDIKELIDIKIAN